MKPRSPDLRFRKEYFLVMLPLFFVLHGYNENPGLIPFGDAFSVLARYVLVSALLAFGFTWLLGSFRKASLFTLGLMALQVFFGPVHDGIKSLAGNSFLGKYTFLLPFILLCVLLLFVYLKRSAGSFNRFVKYANLVLLLFLLSEIISLAVINRKEKDTAVSRANGLNRCDSCRKPDIYFIVADEYAGNRELKEVLQFDNTAFESALEQRGFHIIDSSVSNYNYTPFCLASTFSMEYLSGIEGRNQSTSDRRLCYQRINKNALFDYLKSMDYEIRNYSVFKVDEKLPLKSTSFFRTGKDLMATHTFLGRLDRDIRFNTVTRFKLKSEMKRLAGYELETINHLLDETKKEITTEHSRPRFVYTHLMMPHYPYFFDRSGNPYPIEMLTEGNQWREKNYIEYLQYSNKIFLDLIDQILHQSKTPPVIIFMGDHGFRHFNRPVDHQYHFMNLNAVYLPGKDYHQFYNGMSSVNEFRILLNTVFRQQMPVLKDSTSFLRE